MAEPPFVKEQLLSGAAACRPRQYDHTTCCDQAKADAQIFSAFYRNRRPKISQARASLPRGTKKRVQNKYLWQFRMSTETRRTFWGVGLSYQFH
jgi:hypothetical protein